jgi:hypothetical protein
MTDARNGRDVDEIRKVTGNFGQGSGTGEKCRDSFLAKREEILRTFDFEAFAWEEKKKKAERLWKMGSMSDTYNAGDDPL